MKADVVSADERESGERRILNFGHTIGHALEAETGYKQFLHGEAVGWGMIAATLIGAGMGMTDSLTAQRIIKLVRAYGSLPPVEVRSESIMKRLLSDKKTVGGVPHFILPTSIGKVEVVNTVPSAGGHRRGRRNQTLIKGMTLAQQNKLSNRPLGSPSG